MFVRIHPLKCLISFPERLTVTSVAHRNRQDRERLRRLMLRAADGSVARVTIVACPVSATRLGGG
jgi:hypothetical protein